LSIDDLVPNPRYRDLETALATVRAHIHMLETSLDRACTQFGGKAIWVGPTARAFGAELNGRRARVKVAVQHVVAELEAELRATPKQVPRAAVSAVIGWS
jgi:hypothetical protein